MGIYFHQNKILIRGGQIAMDAECCCQGQCCCGLSSLRTYYATFSAPDCSALDGLVVELQMNMAGVGTVICEYLTNLNFESIPNCTAATVPVVVNLRCNKNLEIRTGEGECDRYEMEVYYPASPCTDTRGWTRVELGCTCSPLNLVFTKKAPSWNGTGGSSDCDCCEIPGSDVTVTVTA